MNYAIREEKNSTRIAVDSVIKLQTSRGKIIERYLTENPDSPRLRSLLAFTCARAHREHRSETNLEANLLRIKRCQCAYLW